MRIEIQNVEFKNFLSYGNSPQRLDFIEGINLILGKNSESGRSNGAGKSSLIETIPFALFGKLSRPINKAGIVNWKNGKNCEVKISFKMGDNTYKVLRAIKPDKLEIYENDTLLPIPSNIKSYQEMFENEKIGFDYNTFMYLFYTNLNTNIPLLKMNTTQKRTFLERMFLLDTYTNLNTITNEKIKNLDEKSFKQKVSTESNEKSIAELENQNSSLRLKIGNITPYEKELKEAKEEYELKQKEYNSLNTVDDIKAKIIEIENTINKEKDTLADVVAFIRATELDNDSKAKYVKDVQQQIENRDNRLKLIDEQLSSGDNVNIVQQVDSIKDKMKKLDESITVDFEMKIQWTEELSIYKEKKSNLEETYEALQGGICPTCNRKLTAKHLDKEYTVKIEELDKKIKEYQVKYNNLLESISKKSNAHTDLKAIIESLEVKRKKRETLSIEKQMLLATQIPCCDSEKRAILDNGIKIERFTKKQKDIILEIEEQKMLLVQHKIEYDGVVEKNDLLKKLSNNIEYLEKELELRKRNKIELEAIIQENDKKIKELKKENVVSNKSLDKIKELIDYLSYLKILCKDENVKQYAISSYMSYLVQQTNFYLSQAGSTHYMKFNKWLEEEIHGPGVFNADYGNLSGGEARSIDLAIQFAFLDVAKLKTGIFPDILLLDEILDSSIDGGGLNNILKIIKTKQYEDKSKTFIITHRTEISDMDVDNTYIVSKNNNGFSIIERV